jgi:DNA transformation protein and related proteins
MKKNEYLLYILDFLEPHGPITAKALFGGHGIYYGTAIIGVIVDNELYFKVDEFTKPAFDQYGSQSFIYKGKTKTVTMPYMKLPELILENREELPQWIENAFQVSLRHQKSSPKKKKQA